MARKLLKEVCVSVALMLPFAAGAVCPLGANETELTVQRVMRNFGRFISDADHLCIKAKNPEELISNEEISAAINQLGLAIDCADEVLRNPTGDLLPSKIEFIQDAKEKKELVDDYIYFMTDFRDELIQYRKLFEALRAQEPALRNFQEINEKRQDLDHLVDRAHKKL